MNYQRIYDNLISKARKRGSLRSSDLYLENHHIIPRCLGGSDELSNLVMLTAEEHYVAHQLLVKIHPSNNKLTFAVHIMCRASDQKHIRNNKEYGWIRKRFAESMRELHRNRVVSEESRQKMSAAKAGKGLGSDNNFYGKTHTEKSKRQMSETRKERQLAVGENNGMFGRKHSEESKKLQSQRAKERQRKLAEWTIRFPDGSISTIECLKNFAKQINSSVYKLKNNKTVGYEILKRNGKNYGRI